MGFWLSLGYNNTVPIPAPVARPEAPTVMDVKLFVEKGNTQIRVIRLRTPETLVGRSSA